MSAYGTCPSAEVQLYLIKHTGNENKEMITKNVFMFKPILTTSTITNVWRPFRRIYMLKLGTTMLISLMVVICTGFINFVWFYVVHLFVFEGFLLGLELTLTFLHIV